MLEHYFAPKLFAASGNKLPGKEEQDKTTMHRIETKFLHTENVFDRQNVQCRDKTPHNFEET
jgi:hypothetical protein